MARTHEELLKLMRGDPHSTDEEILSQNPDMGNFNDVPRIGDANMEMPPSPQLEMPAEDVALGPNGPSLFSRVSNAMQPLANEVAQSPGKLGGKLPSRAPSEISKPALLDMMNMSKAAPMDPYGSELNDAALKAAQESAANTKERGIFGRAGAQLGSGIASLGAGSEVKADTSLFDKMDEQSGQGVKDILTRREGKDAELKRTKMLDDMADENQMRDINSPISVALRDGAKLAGLNVPDSVSGKMLKESGINLGTLLSAKIAADARRDAAAERAEARKESNDLKREKFDQALKENEQKAAKDFSQFIEKDDQMKLFKKEAVALGQVDNLIGAIKSGNTVAAGALGAKMARAMGEVGVLTTEDVSRYVQSGALARGSADKLSKMLTGKPTNATLEEIKQISSILQDSYKSKVQPIYDKYATRLSRIYDIPLEKAYYVMDLPEGKSKKESTSSKDDPRIDQFMQSNGIKDRKEAIKILKENGKI